MGWIRQSKQLRQSLKSRDIQKRWLKQLNGCNFETYSDKKFDTIDELGNGQTDGQNYQNSKWQYWFETSYGETFWLLRQGPITYIVWNNVVTFITLLKFFGSNTIPCREIMTFSLPTASPHPKPPFWFAVWLKTNFENLRFQISKW